MINLKDNAIRLIKNFNVQEFRGDLWGGFAAMLVALPSAVAFGVTIFTPLGGEYGARGAMAGMLGAIILGLVAGLFGGTRRLISAPCAPAAAVLSALTIDMIRDGHPVSVIVTALLLVTVISSLIQLCFGVLRVGQLINYMPYPVVCGYLSGVGIVIIISQLPKWLAYPPSYSLWQGIQHPSLWQPVNFLIGAATAVVMVFMSRFKSSVPFVIYGLLAGFATYWLLALTVLTDLKIINHNPFVIGTLEASITDVGIGIRDLIKSFSTSGYLQKQMPWNSILITALTLSVLLSIDTLKTCIALDSITGERYNPNRELLGQGFGNLLSGLLGGAPGAGTMGPSLVNHASGGQSALSSVFQAVWSLLAVVLLSSVIAWVPIAALSGILVVIGFSMIDWKAFRLLKSKDTWIDFAVIALVVVVANTISLIAASGLGIVLSVLLFMREQIHTSTIRRQMTGQEIFSKRARQYNEHETLVKRGKETLIIELQGSLFFGTTNQLFDQISREIVGRKTVLLDFMYVQSLDYTAGHMIERLGNEITKQNATLVLSHLPDHLPNGRDLHAYIDHLGLSKHPNTRLFKHFNSALEWIEDGILREEGGLGGAAHELGLADFSLLHSLSADDLLALEPIVQKKIYKKGETIFTIGALGHELMLISYGEVRMLLPDRDGGKLLLATLGAGHVFGEMSFLDGVSHAVGVEAALDTQILCFERTAFNKALAARPAATASIMQELARAISRRLRRSNMEIHNLRLT
jgi:sulfate permease, SulP family